MVSGYLPYVLCTYALNWSCVSGALTVPEGSGGVDVIDTPCLDFDDDRGSNGAEDIMRVVKKIKKSTRLVYRHAEYA